MVARSVKRAALFAVLLACAAAARSQPVERPVYRVGDTWTYRHATGPTGFRPGGTLYATETRTVTRMLADEFELSSRSTSEKGETTTGSSMSSLDFNDFATGRAGAPRKEIRAWTWPAVVGGKWTYEVPVGAGEQVWEARVLGWEEVEVPAGKFKALKVEREMISTPNAEGQGRVDTIWFAPEVKANVKVRRESRYRSFVTLNYTRELVSYELAR